jgi:hypothetical protein
MPQTSNKMVFYRPQPDSFGVLELTFVDDDSFTDTPPASVIDLMEIDVLKGQAPNGPGRWVWERGVGFRRFTDAEALEFASGRIPWLNPLRSRGSE